MNFLDICSGIGGFRYGLERAGMECVGYVEIDKYARLSYEAMYDTTGEWTAYDVTKLTPDEIPRADLWCFGFPCQDISVARGQKGLKGLNGKRSGIFYDIIKLIKGKSNEDKPEWLLIENVKNLLSIDGGGGFTEVLSEISEAGYDVEWHLINSKYYGVPQNRERVFIIGRLRQDGTEQILPVTGTDRPNSDEKLEKGRKEKKSKVEDIKTLTIGRNQREYIQEHSGLARSLTATDYKQPQMIAVEPVEPKLKQIASADQVNRIYDSDGISKTIIGSCGGSGARTEYYTVIKDDENDPILKTIKKNTNEHGVLMFDGIEYNVRRLTPKECFRLQGFPDELFERAEKVCSNTQLYKQAGNAVTTTVAYALGKRILEKDSK